MTEKESTLQRENEELRKKVQWLAVRLAALIIEVGEPVTIKTNNGIYDRLPATYDIESKEDERGNWILRVKDTSRR